MKSYSVKENHIGLLVSKILCGADGQTDTDPVSSIVIGQFFNF